MPGYKTPDFDGATRGFVTVTAGTWLNFFLNPANLPAEVKG